MDRLTIGMAGDTVEVSLSGIDVMRLSCGSILSLCPLPARPPIAQKAKAKLLVMEDLDVPIIRGAQVLFHMHSLDVPAVLSNLVSVQYSKKGTRKDRPRFLSLIHI